MASQGGIPARLRQHRRTKYGHCIHFSVFEVWDNIRDDVRELEGISRNIYRDDTRASPLNVARGFKSLRTLRNNEFTTWPSDKHRGRARPNERCT